MSIQENKVIDLLDDLKPVLGNRLYIGFDPMLCKRVKEAGLSITDGKIVISDLISLVINSLTGNELGLLLDLEHRTSRVTMLKRGKKR